ncbi:hypothetical protein, partial [Mycobacteroides abscessus]|uniref:hypothetical protein n=1 Tax=Mycobacteroides abscessus TaxID=36809 RepID=UPI001A991661
DGVQKGRATVDSEPEVERTLGAAALSREQTVYAAVTTTNYPLEVRFSPEVRNWDSYTICDRVVAAFEAADLRYQANEREKIARTEGAARAAASGYPSTEEADRAESALNF